MKKPKGAKKAVKSKKTPREAWNEPRFVMENTDGTGQVASFSPKHEGDAFSFIFPGFAVYLDREGCALILTSAHRDGVKNFQPGQDRLITDSNLRAPGHLKSDVFERVLARTLKRWPKDRVP